MDMAKFGQFLRGQRRAAGLTQAQLAERLGVSNRSVSRWETGNNMPDFDLVIEMAGLFGVSVGELLAGERKEPEMTDPSSAPSAPQPAVPEEMLRTAEYVTEEKARFARPLRWVLLAGLAALLGYAALEFLAPEAQGRLDAVRSFLLGFGTGAMAVAVLYTSRPMARLRAWKLRLRSRLSAPADG